MAIGRALRDSIVEFLLLRRAEERVNELTERQLTLGREYVAAAKRRLALLPGVGDAAVAVITATLVREAAILTVRGRAALQDRGADDARLLAIDVEEALRSACESDPSAPEAWEDGLALVAAQGPLAIDRMKLEDVRNAVAALKSTIAWLDQCLDLRTPEHVRWQRRGRLAALVVAALTIPFFIYRSATALPNVALGKPVTLSSVMRGSPGGSALVDGARSTKAWSTSSWSPDITYTQRESAPYATIDLGENFYISKIRVYNRADGSYDEGLPYRVELSEDGKTYREIGVRTTHFGSTTFDPPWTLELPKERGRWVRVRSSAYLALSEVEVFGR